MEAEKLTCSLEQAIEFNKWGLTEESYFLWIQEKDSDKWSVVPAYDLKKYNFHNDRVYYAYSNAELIKMLKQIKEYSFEFSSNPFDCLIEDEAKLTMINQDIPFNYAVKTFKNEKRKLIEAELLIYAFDQKIVNPDDLSL